MLPSDPFLRHLQACNQATLPGGRTPFFLAGHQTGWVSPEIAPELHRRGLTTADGALALDDPSQLESLGEQLAQDGFYRSHHELFDVSPDPDSETAEGRIDRGALPLFGFRARGVHMNGLVRRSGGLHLWVGHRAKTKRLDPGKLDHLVAGGISAGLTPFEALKKEAAEEASISDEMASQARHVARISYILARPEGLRRDILHCFDLELPESFEPLPADGEVDHFTLMPLREVFECVRETDDFKFNVNLVLIDLFLREGLISPESEIGRTLRSGLDHGLVPDPCATDGH